MGYTMTDKILAKASGSQSVERGEVVLPKVSMVTCPDAATFIDLFNEQGLKLWDPTRMVFCFDHFFQPEWIPQVATKEHPKIWKFAKEQGIPTENIYAPGRNGISHHVPVEEGWALPGTVCIGVDTQASTMGAANCFAIPTIFGTNPIVLTGDIWIVVPECVRLEFRGSLNTGVNGKDIVYRLIKDLGGQVDGKVIEVSGPGVSTLPMDVRLAIANGAAQIGALTIVFPADEVLLGYLQSRAREPFEPVAPDSDARYGATYCYDLASFDCLVAGPHELSCIRPLQEVLGLKIDAANIGSCSSGRFSDLDMAARVLRGRKLKPGVRMVVTPISAATAREAREAGLLQVFQDAGAIVTDPGCGACYSGNLSPLQLVGKERCISTSVETLRGRMGSTEAEILLANSAVVAASALAGCVADPSHYVQERSMVRS